MVLYTPILAIACAANTLLDRFGEGVLSLAGLLLLADDEPLVVLFDEVDILFEPLLLCIWVLPKPRFRCLAGAMVD
jgi:hypothetical protein